MRSEQSLVSPPHSSRVTRLPQVWLMCLLATVMCALTRAENNTSAGKINLWLRKLKWPRVTEAQLRKVLMGRGGYHE